MRYITLDTNNKVISVRNGPSIAAGEIQSDTGELGQVRQPDGTFTTPVPPTTPEPTEPTLEDKINYLYYKTKGVIA